MRKEKIEPTYEGTFPPTGAVTALETREIEASIRGERSGRKIRPVPTTFLMISALVVCVLRVGVALVRDPPLEKVSQVYKRLQGLTDTHRASSLGHGEKRNESDRNGLHVEFVFVLERQTV